MLTFALATALAAAPAPTPAFAPKDRPYDAIHYKLEFRLGEAGAFTNTVSVTLNPRRTLNEVELDFKKLNITDAKLADGTKATFVVKGDTLLVRPARALAAGKQETLVIAVSGKANDQHEGFFVTWNPDDPEKTPYYYTHFEPTAASSFYPCNDQPFDKATTEVLAVVPSDLTVLSNGKKVKDEAFSEGGQNLRRVHWLQDKPHSTYLLALAIGELESVDVGAEVPAALHLLPGTKDRAFVTTDATLRTLSFEAAFLGVKYPWAKYDQVVVPRFFWNGMENTSLVMLRENTAVLPTRNYILGRSNTVGLVAHELAHQWFGDYVTLKWWDDVWLNEGFATYLGSEATDSYFDNELVEIDRAADTLVWYMREEDGPRSHALKAKNLGPGQLFDSTSYTKGAHVLRMLEQHLGREEFKKGLKAYLEQYAFSNATSDDFFAAVGKATKKDKEVRAFKDAWVTQRGYPILSPTWEYADGTLTVTVKQRPNHPDAKVPFVFKLPVTFHRITEPTYSTDGVITVDKAAVTAKFQLPATPQWVTWNKEAAALVRIEEKMVSEEQWTLAARNDKDPVWRLIAQYALMANFLVTSDKELQKPSDAAMGTLLDGLASDESPYVREAMLQRLGQSSWPKLPPEFGPVVLSLAKRPEKLAEDALGNLRVRAAALELLGKIDHAEAQKYAIAQLQKQELDVNFVAAAATGVARIGTSVALAELGAAIASNRARGSFFWRAAATGLGAFPGPDVVPLMKQFLKDARGNNELARVLPPMLNDNVAVKESVSGIAFVKEIVLGEDWGDDIKARMLGVLDEVKNDAAKAALTEISQKTPLERIKIQADRVLAANFPPPPPEKPARGGKKTK